MQAIPFPYLLPDNFSFNDKSLGLPMQIWKKEYDTNKEKLIEEVVNPLMNHLCKTAFSGGLYHSPNTLQNYDRFYGKFDGFESEYNMAYLYSEFQNEGEEKLRDFNFYWYAINRIEAELNRHDIRFSVDIINREAGLSKKKKIAEVGAEAQVRNIINQVLQATKTDEQSNDGVDLSFAKNKDIYVPTKIDELYEQLNEKEISSAQVYTLLNHIKRKYNLKREVNSKSLQDKAILNACFGQIEINNENDPVYTRIAPNNISWIGPAELGSRGFDESCDAVQVTEYIPVTKAFIKDRGILGTNLSTYEKIKEKIDELKGLKDNTSNTNFQTTLQDEHGTFWFYKNGNGLFVCRQHLYFKMLVSKNVKLSIDGRNLSEDEYKELLDYGSNKDSIEFKTVEDDYKPTASEKLIQLPIVKLYEAVRYGREYVVMVKEVPNQMRRSNNWIEVQYPLTACVWKDKSIVSLGVDFGYLYHVVMKKLTEEIKDVSVSDVLNYDVDNLPDGYTAEMIPMMVKSKLNLYSGSKMSNAINSKESYRHLTTSKISVNPNEINALLNLAMICANTFYRILGIPQETGFIQKLETQNENQESPIQSSLALLPFYDEFMEEYVNQVLQKLADIGRYSWSRDEYKTVILGKGNTDTIKIDPSVLLAEQGIFVTNDYKARKDKEYLMGAGMRAVSAGALDFGELVKMYHSENPEHILAMFNDGMSTLEKLKQQDAQLQQQMAQMAQQMQEQKLQIPILVEQERTKRELTKQEMIDKNKDEREAAKLEMKGELTDIEHLQDKDKMQFKNELDKSNPIKKKK